jgi:aminoglycoside phosphotransferase (APT) family kinase protein
VPEWSAEVTVDADLARRLVREQFPEVGGAIRQIGEGWDHTVWLVDEEWVFRFPRRSVVVPGMENELATLPRLAPLLPLPVPVPTFVGRPSEMFPWPFFGHSLVPGRELAYAALDDDGRAGLARPLAEFLRSLHAVELDVDLPVDPNHRAEMNVRVPRAREYLSEVERLRLWRAPQVVHQVLEDAEGLPASEQSAVVHGDLHLRHLLVDGDGSAAGVIDWIDVCRADPGIDLVLYWSTLPHDGRVEFLETYGPVTEDQLLRGRVVAFFLCAVLAVFGHSEGLDRLTYEALEGLARTAS